MAPTESAALWTVRPPVKWPTAPDEMTVTTLADIELCPRRWALSAAEYSEVWNGRGYPPRLQLNALAGTVVHLALETITRELVHTACPSVEDSKASQVLRSLGGYTKVILDSIDRVLDRFNNNPRAIPLLEVTARTLRAQASELRMRAQTLLSRIRLPASSVARSGQSEGPLRRIPLKLGAYSEIEFRSRRAGWKGKADLLVLSADGCEISDFKTGAQDDGHLFQIRVYALLWSSDEELNPTRRLANHLVLRYDGGDVAISAPTATELDELERELIARGDAARRAVSGPRPEARPAPETCRFCGVRQLCVEYWEAARFWGSAPKGTVPVYTDVQLTITGRHGPSSWDGSIEIARDVTPGKTALLRTKGDRQFRAGDRLRVLDAAITINVEDDEQPVVIILGTMSETYAVL